MNLENNHQYSSFIKQEYLPPPLENNYLSLFDIQVKMAKQFLKGSEEQKAMIIKKRIIKFFDYGNDSTQSGELDFSSKQKNHYPPFEIRDKKIKQNLEIDCSKIILYAKQSPTFQSAQKLFPSFVGFQKINDCNIKLTFATSRQCQNSLLQKVKTKGAIITEHIKYPYDIQWFQIEGPLSQNNQSQKTFYARFVTNKDNFLFQNDKYFRKLLGKARQIIDKKEKQEQQRQKEIEDHTLRKAQRKKYYVKRDYQKKYSKDFDAVTNYDGVYVDKQFNRLQEAQQFSYQYTGSKNLGSKSLPKNKHNLLLDSLNLSEIKPIEQQFDRRNKTQKRDRPLSSFKGQDKQYENHQKRRNIEEKNIDPRDKLIRDFRDKSSKRMFSRPQSLSNLDYNKEIEKNLLKEKKPYYEIN